MLKELLSGAVGYLLGSKSGSESDQPVVINGAKYEPFDLNFKNEENMGVKSFSVSYFLLMTRLIPLVVWMQRLERYQSNKDENKLALSLHYWMSRGTSLTKFESSLPLQMVRTSLSSGYITSSNLEYVVITDDPQIGGRPNHRIFSKWEGVFFKKEFAFMLFQLGGLERISILAKQSNMEVEEFIKFGNYSPLSLIRQNDLLTKLYNFFSDEELQVYHNPITGKFYFQNVFDDQIKVLSDIRQLLNTN